ncbi:hypothetical protein MRQ36_17265 [Micromonospora sp. R77]|nr:hypothetical protein [Micromonospora sp. R77]
MDVLSMWACLQDQETTGHWKQVAGWRKVCDLAQTHLGRLREYRRGLAEAWPPETNAAARTYIVELDQLIDKVQRTHDAAAANHDALSAAARALGSARAGLEPIYQEYATKLQQKQSYEATVADPKALAGSRLPDQPVTAADLERLNVQARELMTGLSGELQQAQVMLRRPPTPKTWPGVDHLPPDQQPPPASIPTVPPIVPMPLAISNTPLRSTKPAATGQPLPTPAAPGVGPVLGGAGTGLAPAPNNPGLSATPSAPPPTSAAGAPSLPTLPNMPSRTTFPGQFRNPAEPGGRPLPGSINREPPHAIPPRSTPLGGLIGGPPGMAMGQPGGAVPPRRVNPVGGVIGGGGAGTAPTGAAGSRPGAGRAFPSGVLHGTSPLGGAPGAGSYAGSGTPPLRPTRRENDESEPRRWDPDHPWEVDQGVDPIVRPPDEEGPIDPGPAIGFDR